MNGTGSPEYATYEPRPGEHIYSACKNARKMADSLGKPVRFVFNDTPVVVAPGTDVKSAARQWQKDFDAAADA